jgi:hypothetical protein
MKADRRVILDSRNRELKYLFPSENVHRAIEELKKHGKKPWRVIMKKIR